MVSETVEAILATIRNDNDRYKTRAICETISEQTEALIHLLHELHGGEEHENHEEPVEA